MATRVERRILRELVIALEAAEKCSVRDECASRHESYCSKHQKRIEALLIQAKEVLKDENQPN